MILPSESRNLTRNNFSFDFSNDTEFPKILDRTKRKPIVSFNNLQNDILKTYKLEY